MTETGRQNSKYSLILDKKEYGDSTKIIMQVTQISKTVKKIVIHSKDLRNVSKVFNFDGKARK